LIFILGIIGAMDREVTLFIKNLERVSVMTRASMTFYTGVLNGKNVVVVKCGVGKVNAAVCTQILIDNYKPERVICTGVAGALRDNLDIGDTVIASDVVQHDVDATNFGHELGEIPNLGVKYFKSCPELMDMAVKIHARSFKKSKVYVGRILTGDQFVCSKEKTDFLRRTFGGYCVEMEGGSIGQVCYLNDIPFLVIRSISDRSDGKAVSDYTVFADETANKSFYIVSYMVKLLGMKNK
jgi:adenosylhomocysteine nucleosidase